MRIKVWKKKKKTKTLNKIKTRSDLLRNRSDRIDGEGDMMKELVIGLLLSGEDPHDDGGQGHEGKDQP